MRYNGSLYRLLTIGQGTPIPGSDESLPEVEPGAFAAWAKAASAREAGRAAAGDVCTTPDGRTGHVVEILDGGHRVLVCQPA